MQFWQDNKSVRLKNARSENALPPTKHFINVFGSVRGHIAVYLRCKETVELFRFLLSPYIVVETYNSAQKCIFRDCAGTLYTLL
jgi:hypothetical protein